jgi:acetyl esterase/lipase
MASVIGSKFIHLLLMLGIPTWLFANIHPVPPQPTTITGAITHLYKSIDGAELRLHVFNPPNHQSSVKQAAIIFYFGGGWAHGSVEQFVPQAKYLAQRGMVAIVTDYRVSGRYKTSPFEAMADAKSAIRWVRFHAAELGIDPNRIAAGGGSAGGHIALSAAIFDGFDEIYEDKRVSSKPNALVLFNPAIDTTTERTKEHFGNRGREASPLHHIVPNLPPMIILHGKADTTVPYPEVEHFCSEVRSRGNQCQLFGFDGAHHGFYSPHHKQGLWYRETLLEVDRFLTKLDYLPRPAPLHVS